MDKKKLTPRQAAFAREIAKGSNYSEAYKLTHNVKESTTAKSINTLASRLASKVEIRLRVEELQAKRERAVINSAVSDRDQVLKLGQMMQTIQKNSTN
jgi:dihydroneopterin aldolase